MSKKKNPLRRKCSILCYDHKCIDQCCIQFLKSWQEVCRFIENIGKNKSC